MRFIVLFALLLPVSANAATYNKADCEFLQHAAENCYGGYGAFRSGAEARWGQEFSERHPSFNALGPQIITIHHKYCNASATPITNGCEGRSSLCNELPDGNLEFRCYQGTYVASKETGKIVKDNCNKY